MSVTPETFTVTHSYAHPVSLVFWAFTDINAKREWFGDPRWETSLHTLDFTVGGWERWRGRPNGDAPWMTNDTLYLDIVPDRRIIHHYSMTMNGKLFTVSQQVLTFSTEGEGCRLDLIEQILFIDGVDHLPQRIEGTQALLAGLNAFLDRHANTPKGQNL